MDNREIDAKVAEAMELEVLGKAWASEDPEITDWWHVHAVQWEGRTLQPVYLGHCSCDLYPSDTPELDPTETVLGHYVYCLEVVPHYTTDISAAMTLLDKLKEDGLTVQRLLTGAALGDWWQCHVADAWRQVSHEGDKDYFANAETRELAICLAFLRAMGVEMGEGEER